VRKTYLRWRAANRGAPPHPDPRRSMLLRSAFGRGTTDEKEKGKIGERGKLGSPANRIPASGICGGPGGRLRGPGQLCTQRSFSGQKVSRQQGNGPVTDAAFGIVVVCRCGVFGSGGGIRRGHDGGCPSPKRRGGVTAQGSGHGLPGWRGADPVEAGGGGGMPGARMANVKTVLSSSTRAASDRCAQCRTIPSPTPGLGRWTSGAAGPRPFWWNSRLESKTARTLPRPVRGRGSAGKAVLGAGRRRKVVGHLAYLWTRNRQLPENQRYPSISRRPSIPGRPGLVRARRAPRGNRTSEQVVEHRSRAQGDVRGRCKLQQSTLWL